MKMHERNARRREVAAAVVGFYAGHQGDVDDDPVAAITDLIANLLHYAETLITPDPNGEGLTYEVVGIADRAAANYEHETDPANADKEV